MTGREHIITALPVCAWMLHTADNPMAARVLVPTGITSYVAALAAAGLVVLGVLLPDCDYKGSIISRVLYIPIEHRTWTHALWFPIAVTLVALAYPSARILLWLVIGYVLHLAMDACGPCGICWLYPKPGYHVYESGARVKRGNHLKLYGSGEYDANRGLIIGGCVILAVLLFFIPL